MAATIFKTTAAGSLVHGVTDETSIIITNYSRNVTAKKTEVMGAGGDVVAVAFTGKTAEITVDGYVNGAISLNIAAIATLANDTTRYGVTGGTVLINSISESTGQGEFAKVSISMTQYSETLA
jgi:hypothetical protein